MKRELHDRKPEKAKSKHFRCVPYRCVFYDLPFWLELFAAILGQEIVFSALVWFKSVYYREVNSIQARKGRRFFTMKKMRRKS